MLGLLAPVYGRAADGNSAGADTLAEVTVTAERRATDLQDTPIAVSSLNADDLQQQGLTDFRDLSGRIPNLMEPKRSTAYSTQIFSIRGIGETDTYPAPSVALYVDDQYLARSVGAMYDTPDLSQVEVLRGPQGTLYGRNSPAGAIRFLTPDPTDQTRGYTELGYGSFNEVVAKSTLSGAVVDGLVDASVSYIHRQRDGWLYDTTQNKDVNAIGIDAVKSKILFKPSEDVRVLLGIDGMVDNSDASYYSAGVKNGSTFTYSGSNPNTTAASLSPYNRTRTGGVSLRVTDALNDHLTVKSVTAAHGMQGPILYDNTARTSISNINWAGFNQHQYTQEVTLNGDWDRLHFVSGLFYFHEYFNNNRVAETATNAAGTVGSLNQYNSALKTDSVASFGQAELKVTPDLTAIVGGRYTLDHQEFINGGFNASGVPLINSGLQATLLNYAYSLRASQPSAVYHTDTSGDWHNFSPKLGLEYQWTPQIMQYATYSRGFKSGGFDLRSTTALTSSQSYAPETTTTYEVGFKGEFFDRKLRTNFAAFYNDITNTQLSVLDPALVTLRRLNGGDSYTEGLEFEANALPAKGLEWDNSAAYLYSGYTKFTAGLPAGNTGNITTLVGREFPLAPHIQLSSGLNYVLPLPRQPGTWRVGVNAQYQTGFFTDVYNTGALRMPAQFFANSTVNYTSEDQHWFVDLSIKNLTDVQYPQTGSLLAAGNYSYYGYNPPRTVLLTVRYTY